MSSARSAGDGVLTQVLDHLHRLERNNFGWRAAHLHLSKLKARNRRDFQLRIAANEFEPLLRNTPGELFCLEGGDMVYFWNGAAAAEVDEVVLRLRYLFSDDPLISEGERTSDEPQDEGGEAAAKFCTWYDLECDLALLTEEIEELARQREAQGVKSNGSHASSGPAKPLEPATLARLEQSLATADLSAFIQRQPICALLPNQPPQPIVTEVHMAIAEVAKEFAPGVDLTSDPWLFQRLVETLDRRLLSTLAETEQTGAISINLRLPTLLSPDFLKFDQQFRRRGKIEAVVELQLIDIFAELGGYMFVRDFLRERHYRICIDGLHHLHLPLINRRRLGADLVKLVWSPDLLDETGGRHLATLRKAAEACGTDRMILCRCDSSSAVDWGHSLGIRLFQGHYLDSRLRAQRAPSVNAARAALRRQAG